MENNLTFALVILTGIYVFLTFKILRANQKTIEVMASQVHETTRPRVICALTSRPGTGLLILRIENKGMTSAKQLSLEVDRDVGLPGAPEARNNLRKLRMFSAPTPDFPPGEPSTFTLGAASVILNETGEPAMPLQFSIRAQYQGDGKDYDETTEIDLMTQQATSIENDSVASAIDRLAEVIKGGGR